jgi:hypothetical protein
MFHVCENKCECIAHTHTLLKSTHTHTFKNHTHWAEHQKLCENVPEGGGVWVQMNEDRCACDMCGYICLLKVQNRQTENIVEVYIDR